MKPKELTADAVWRRFEEALAGILSYGRADMCRRPGEEG